MSNPEGPFNFELYRKRLRRARQTFVKAAVFKDMVAQDFAERVACINTRFPNALDIGCRLGQCRNAFNNTAQANEKIDKLAEADWVDNFTPQQINTLHPDNMQLDKQSFNLITAGLSLHVVNDLPGALIQIRRALKPDGLFLGAVYGPQTLKEWRECLTEAELELTGGAAQRFAPFIDVKDMGSLLQRAGFTNPVTDTDTHTIRYAHPLNILSDIRNLGESSMLANQHPLRRDVLMHAAKLYLDRYSHDDGRVYATLEIITASGWTPR